MSYLHLLCLAPALALILQGCAGVPAEPPKIERISAEQLEARLPQPVAAMPLEQIVALSNLGIPAEELIGRITTSGSRYRLSATQIIELAKQGVPLAVLDHMVAAERSVIFDGMAADANKREQACRDRIEHEVRVCRSQMMSPVWFPGPHPFGHCFPMAPGSPFWHCM
ncbi:MAG: hypothetical protein OEL20_16810 [Sulfuritalea sp.]|nr:hypothetical protein [Sulfuritalea sp.]